jgi:hypothetical protein
MTERIDHTQPTTAWMDHDFRWVYFIAAGDINEDGTPVKVGISNEPEKRLATLQGAHYEELRIVEKFPLLAEYVAGDERALHTILKPDRIRGEWFKASPRLRALLYDLGDDPLENWQLVHGEAKQTA